ncbi:hypothetical protein [Aromatoleum anaerobium]|uniref:Asparagine synthetase domain-containing protein n=1 Tax=Aromatoleum anaerobium TaxID=182180 RepID=A0ABX1PPI7_9RHOO|nr:hypothetical protein [Aromatoleum anaerobium]MCK0505739.1 hypothetical protein [Aromatoleum anaerobium]
MIQAFLAAKHLDPALLKKSVNHLSIIAKRYGKHLSITRVNEFDLALVSDDPEPNCDLTSDGQLEFFLGKLHNNSEKWDRFLRARVSRSGIEFENDYAGSIPVFFSTRNGFIASNIEPCTFLASGSSLDDLSPENIYGFMRYSHFIWNETAWKHIFQLLPDSRYKFSTGGELTSTENLESIRTSSVRASHSDKMVANELFELNRHLVTRSLAHATQIVLPLSSGYDSRMIFAVLASDKALASKTRCFTYGSAGSIEVESAKRLAKQGNIEWRHIDLPCKFLTKNYLKDICDIFGSSVHMHGMYQVEFVHEIQKKFGIAVDSLFTSGFMTGVPAGQHSGLLNIANPDDGLSEAMGRFSQSKFWNRDELKKLPLFGGRDYEDEAENKFRLAFERMPGDIHHKAIIFDVWTRQRNFISYYPRTIEWFYPVASPHLCSEYANFFLSLNEKHLRDRRAVELMFKQHYPGFGSIASNSKGISSIGSPVESFMLLSARILNRLGMGCILPKQYQLAPFEFNLRAVSNCGTDSFYPMWNNNESVREFLDLFGGTDFLRDLYERTTGGSLPAYAKTLTVQAISSDIERLRKNPDA